MNYEDIYNKLKAQIAEYLKEERVKFQDFFKCEITLVTLYLSQQKELGGYWPIFANYRNLGRNHEIKQLYTKLSHCYEGISSTYYWERIFKQYSNLTNERNLFRINKSSDNWQDWTFELNNNLLPEEIKERIILYRQYLEDFNKEDHYELRYAQKGKKYLRWAEKYHSTYLELQIPNYMNLEYHIELQEPLNDIKDIIIELSDLDKIAEQLEIIDPKEKWIKRFTDIKENLINPKTRNKIESIKLSQVHHLLGLVSSGKSTLIDLLLIWGSRNNIRTTLILNDVGSQLDKVRLLNKYNILAIPFFGKWNLHERIEEAQERLTDEIKRSLYFESFDDLEVEPFEFEWLNPFCILNGEQTVDQRIEFNENPPCLNLKNPENMDESFTCPYITICPRFKDYQQMFKSYIWIVNPNSLIDTKISPPFYSHSTPVLEMVYKYSNIVIIDEVDLIQARFDDIFSETFQITGSDSFDEYNHIAEERFFSRNYDQVMNNDGYRIALCLNEYNRAKTNLIHQLITSRNFNHRINQLFVSNSIFNVDSLIRKLSKLQKYHNLEPDLYNMLEPLTKKEYLESHIIPKIINFNFETKPDKLVEVLSPEINEFITKLPGSYDFNNITNTYEEKRDDKKTYFLIIINFILSLAVFDYYLKMIMDDGELINITLNINLETFQRAFRNKYEYYRSLIPAPIYVAGRSGYNIKIPESGGLILELLRYHGVGRYIIYHFHELFYDRTRIKGPKVLLTSSTSWVPEADKYHVEIEPEFLLRSSSGTIEEIEKSQITFVKVRKGDSIVKVSGTTGSDRSDNLRYLVEAITQGDEESHLQEILDNLPEERQNILLTAGSYSEALIVLDVMIQKFYWQKHVICLVPDDFPKKDDEYHIYRSQVESMRFKNKKILIAPTITIERGKNILNDKSAAFFGAIGFLVRPYPVPYDFSSLIGNINRVSIQMDIEGINNTESFREYAQRLRNEGFKVYRNYFDNQKTFHELDNVEKLKIVSTITILMLQTIGRTIRGESRTHILLYDGAFIDDTSTDKPFEDPRSFINQVINYLRMKKNSKFVVDKEIFAPIAELFERIKMRVI